MKNTTQKWLDQSQYDYDTAKAMLDTGRYLYVGFMCQQAIEKALKAVIVERENAKAVPHVHNLLVLVDKIGLTVSEEQRETLKAINTMYMNNRYPNFKQYLAETLTQEYSTKIYTEAGEMLIWIKTQF